MTHPELDAALPVDFATNSIGTSITLPRSEGGRSIAFDSVNERLIATLQDAKGLSLIDTTTNTVIPIPCVEGVCAPGLLPLPANPFGVVVATAPDCPPRFPSSATPTASSTPIDSATTSIAASATPTPTNRETPSPTASVSSTATTTAIFTPTPSAPATPTYTVATPVTCVGDCNKSNAVTIDELVLAVNLALGGEDADTCPGLDHNQDHRVTIDELIAAVNRALSGCGT